MNARNQAIASQDAQIAQNVAVINQQKAKPTAIQEMAFRLNISTQNLQKTLMDTVFKGAKESEFTALIVVANEYSLNPLTKEIYAFPARGGGIVPVVSIDGWIRIANSHPQYDGSEQNFIYGEDGKLFAVETTIYRKDRKHPIKKMEFLSECKRGTDPWKMEHRMLGHKGFIQCSRYAFGFSGIYDDGDGEVIIDYAPQQEVMPTSKQISKQQPSAQHQSFDAETGEIQDNAQDDEAIARQLDQQTDRELSGDDYTQMPLTAYDIQLAIADFRNVPDLNSYWLSDEVKSALMQLDEADLLAMEAKKKARISEIKSAA